MGMKWKCCLHGSSFHQYTRWILYEDGFVEIPHQCACVVQAPMPIKQNMVLLFKHKLLKF